MGFLSSLGEVAQGANKGLLAAQEINERRARREAAELQTKLATEKDAREAQLASDIANQRKIGDPIGLGGVGYQLDQNVPPPAPAKEDSFLGKVAGRLAGVLGIKDVNDVAVATGVKPPPPVVGLGTGQAAAAPAARAAAPIAPPPAAPAAEPTITPSRAPADYATGLPAGAAAAPAAEAVTPAAVSQAASGDEPKVPDRMPVADTNGQITRPTNAIDRELYLAEAYARARDIPKANEHYKKHGDLIIDRQLKVMNHGTPTEMTYQFQTLSGGKPYQITQSPDDPDLFNLTLAEKGADGKPVQTQVLKNVGRKELQAAAGEYLDQDPDARDAAIKASRDEITALMESRAKVQAYKDTSSAAQATTAEKVQATDLKKKAATKAEQWDVDLHTFSEDGSYLLDPAGFDKFMAEGGIKVGDNFYTTSTAPDAATGLAIKEQTNKMQALKDSAVRVWKANPFTAGGVVQVAVDPADNKPKFAVMNSDGTPGAFFPSLVGAISHAGRQEAYAADPAGWGAKIKAAQAATATTEKQATAKTERKEALSTPEGRRAARVADVQAAAEVFARDKEKRLAAEKTAREAEEKKRKGGAFSILKHDVERPKVDRYIVGKSALNLILPRDKQLKIKKPQ
jgi:hypothetical protein